MVMNWPGARLYDRAAKSWWALQHAMLLGDAPRQGVRRPRLWLDGLPLDGLPPHG